MDQKTQPSKKEVKTKMVELARSLDKASIDSMKEALQSIYKDKNIPFDVSHLEASMVAIELAIPHPSMSQMTKEFLIQTILFHYRMIDELENGILSPL